MSDIPNGWFTVLNTLKLGDSASSRSNTQAVPSEGYELRLDLWKTDWPQELPSDWNQVLITDRGGALSPDSESRTKLRNQLCLRKNTWLDVDLRSDAPAPENVRWILSQHLHQDQPDALKNLTTQAQELGAVAAKLVLPAETSLQRRLDLLQQARNSAFPCVAFSLASKNHADRLWAMESGQPWGYLSNPDLQEELPGLLTADELTQRYQWSRSESPQTRFLILGESVGHSLSPDWHNRIFVRNGVPARFYPWATNQPDQDLEAWKSQEMPNLKGLAITTPHKAWAKTQGIEILTQQDPAVKDSPTWNTLIQHKDHWAGTSTDGLGAWNLMVEALQSNPTKKQKLVVLGRGGAAQSVAKTFEHRGWEVSLACRPGTLNSRNLNQDEFHITDDPECLKSAGVLINATGSDSKRSNDWPWDLENFSGTVALEMDYSAGHTAFEEQLATRKEITIFSGYDFFASQARLQAQLFCGVDVSLEESMELVCEIRRERRQGQYPTAH